MTPLEFQPEEPYVSRAGAKLAAALDAFGVNPDGTVCADLGCNVGGFTDCLLQRGAEKVYAVDTGYGQFAWKLRKHERVVTMERTNALHVTLPDPMDIVVIDVGWTRQHHILPVAMSLLRPGGVAVSLIKPHYEAERSALRRGVLPEEDLPAVLEAVNARLADLALAYAEVIRSPIRGQKGNVEYLGMLRKPE